MKSKEKLIGSYLKEESCLRTKQNLSKVKKRAGGGGYIYPTCTSFSPVFQCLYKIGFKRNWADNVLNNY